MAKTTTTKATKKANGSSSQSFEMQVAKVLTSANALLVSLKALGLPVLTDEERTHTNGKLRAGEPAAMDAIFDTVDANPALFTSLAGKDGGTNPGAVETQPARDALNEFEALSPLSGVFAQMETIVSDGMISNGQLAKELSVPAYAIGKAVAATNAKVRASLAPAITFYGAKTRQAIAAKKRSANAATRAAKAAKKGTGASA